MNPDDEDPMDTDNLSAVDRERFPVEGLVKVPLIPIVQGIMSLGDKFRAWRDGTDGDS